MDFHPSTGATPAATLPATGDFCHWWNFFVAIALSGASGFKATLPVFVLSLLQQLEPESFPVAPQVHWLKRPEVCGLLGLALLLEILADQIPAVDHALHALLAPVHPVMGAAAAVAPNYCGGMMARVPMAFVGGGLAGMVHSGKVVVRAASTGSSGGMLNPVVSHCENFLTGALVVCSILSPIFAVGAACFFLIAGCLGFQWTRHFLGLGDEKAAAAIAGKSGGTASTEVTAKAAAKTVPSAPIYEDLEEGRDRPKQPLLAVEQGDIAQHEIDRILAAPNLHWVLGGGNSAETRQEYRRLLRLLHPDRGQCSGPRASQALQRVVEAHSALHGASA